LRPVPAGPGRRNGSHSDPARPRRSPAAPPVTMRYKRARRLASSRVCLAAARPERVPVCLTSSATSRASWIAGERASSGRGPSSDHWLNAARTAAGLTGAGRSRPGPRPEAPAVRGTRGPSNDRPHCLGTRLPIVRRFRWPACAQPPAQHRPLFTSSQKPFTYNSLQSCLTEVARHDDFIGATFGNGR